MNQNKTSSIKIKDPYLKLRYARGAGDIVACFLHCKAVGWLTKLITGKDKPCIKCFKRGNALNIIFPIKVWKLFFDTEEEYIEALKKDLKESGYSVAESSDNKALSTTKIERTLINNKNPFITLKSNEISSIQHKLLASSDNYIGDFLIKTQVFKVK